MSDTQPDSHTPFTPVSLDLQPGDVVAGRYRLIEPLGEGGMGVVWRAQQTSPVDRPVALKLIKLGMDSKAVLARFDAERQALALMDHPNVAKVFDGGLTEHGRPYFAMELVKGLPITEHCDKHRLNLPDRLSLFMQVCDAVQHAHAKGVVHRDLKPANILVGYGDPAGAHKHDGAPHGRGGPKVIDFGVAKALNQRLTEATVFTTQGQLIGTPEYMSPEQAEMTNQDIDTRSDVYSLGVILYELLTGARPFDPQTLRAAGLAEIQRVIREVDPPKPSTKLSDLTTKSGDPETGRRIAAERRTELRTLAGTLRRDLDWVVMKCLEKDRERRYDTPIEVAAELQRFLNDEPVDAGPPSAGYRVRKFVKRNRVPVVGVAAMVVTLTLGFAGTSYGFAWALRERAIAEDARATADVAALQAKEQTAIASRNYLLSQVDRGTSESALGERLRHASDLRALISELNPDDRRAELDAVLLHINVLSDIRGVESEHVRAIDWDAVKATLRRATELNVLNRRSGDRIDPPIGPGLGSSARVSQEINRLWLMIDSPGTVMRERIDNLVNTPQSVAPYMLWDIHELLKNMSDPWILDPPEDHRHASLRLIEQAVEQLSHDRKSQAHIDALWDAAALASDVEYFDRSIRHYTELIDILRESGLHEDAYRASRGLARVHQSAGDHAEAIRVLHQCAQQDLGGAFTYERLLLEEQIAESLLRSGDATKANGLLEDLLDRYNEWDSLGEIPSLFYSGPNVLWDDRRPDLKLLMSDALKDLGRMTESESVLLELYEASPKQWWNPGPERKAVIDRLVVLYRASDRREEADEWELRGRELE